MLVGVGTAWAYPKFSRYAAERDREAVVSALPPAQEFLKATTSSSRVSLPPVQKIESPPPAASAINLKVPFTIQAPYQIWDVAHNEACEEASVAMVDAFVDGRIFTRENAEKEILDLEAWEVKRFGYFEDTSAEETATILREYYGYKDVRVFYDFKAEDIRSHLRAGRPVIIPAAGRLLKNPNFRGAGPEYHMLVIKGFSNAKFVTNDPGTRRGADYIYSETTIMHAANDWSQAAGTLSGRRAMIVVYP